MKAHFLSRSNWSLFLTFVALGLATGYSFFLYTEHSSTSQPFIPRHETATTSTFKNEINLPEIQLTSGVGPNSLEKKLAGLSAYDSIKSLAPIRQTEEVRLLREKLISQLNFGQLTALEVASLRSYLSTSDHLQVVRSFFENLDFNDTKKALDSISVFERELSTSKTREAILDSMTSSMIDWTPTKVLRITDSLQQPELSLEILSKHLLHKAISPSQASEILQLIESMDIASQKALLTPVFSSLFSNSPQSAIEAATNSPDPTFLENLLVNNIALENITDLSVEKALASATPYVRSKAAERLANQILNSDTNMSAFQIPSSSPELAKEVGNFVGARLAENLPPESFAKIIKSISDPVFKEGMTLNIGFYQSPEYVNRLSLLLSK